MSDNPLCEDPIPGDPRFPPADGMAGTPLPPVETKPLVTDSELIALLRSSDRKDRGMALGIIYPDEAVVLLGVADGAMSMCSPPNRPGLAPHLFALMCWGAGFIGNQLGMSLQWGQTKKSEVLVVGADRVPRG